MTQFALIAQAGVQADPRADLMRMIGMLVIFGVMFYFLLIRPQQRQRKQHDQMIRNIKSGDRILTSGGIYGIVTNVKEKSLMVKIADNVKVEVAKTAISTVMQKPTESESSSEDQK